MQNNIKVGWKVASLNLSIASLRYRAIYPILALKKLSVVSKVFSNSEPKELEHIDVLVIVKSFTYEDFLLAKKAVGKGIPVLFDLCDNIFIEKYKSKQGLKPEDVFLKIASIAAAVIVTTPDLARVVESKVGPSVPVIVVPDVIETPQLNLQAKKILFKPRLVELYKKSLKQSVIVYCFNRIKHIIDLLKPVSLFSLFKQKLRKVSKFSLHRAAYILLKHLYKKYDAIRSFLKQKVLNISSFSMAKESVVSNQLNDTAMQEGESGNARVSRILWFGNHGAKHASFGLSDLLLIQKKLEILSTEMAVELWVVSNNKAKYKKLIAPMLIKSRYFEWSPKTLNEALNKADVVVVPNSLDEFSVCKSANRTLLALQAEVPVVATKTEALSQLEGYIRFDNFEENLRYYLLHPKEAKSEARIASKYAHKLFNERELGRAWMRVLDLGLNAEVRQGSDEEPELIFVLHLPQDIDLISPIVEEAKKQGIKSAAWTCINAASRWVSLMPLMKKLNIPVEVFSDNLSELSEFGFPGSVKYMLSATETSLNPHRFAHRLTKLANDVGIVTATLQHGFENVALTYSDLIQDIRKVNIESRCIYIWGGRHTLHPNIQSELAKKCIPVGCTKDATVDFTKIDELDSAGNGKVIGIFENLHWHRYSDEYREFFMENVFKLPMEYPDFTFVIKPHSAGMWLKKRFGNDWPEMKNVLFIDPTSSAWRDVSISMLFHYLSAVITTPSTVAIDAARANVPVSVIAHELDLSSYEPLPIIRTHREFRMFLNSIKEDSVDLSHVASKGFLDKYLCNENASRKIIDHLQSVDVSN